MVVRWIAAALTLLAVVGGLWGFTNWLRSGPPPIGDIPLAAVTPPGTELDIYRWDTCHPDVPGYWAAGESTVSPAELDEWFSSRFGAINEEATLRRNQTGQIGAFVVYDDITTWIASPGATTSLSVWTYETVGHECMYRYSDIWDLQNARAYTDACDRLAIDFWGVDYGAGDPSDPPDHWSVLTFPAGQEIAHGSDRPTVIYARTAPDESWMEYERGAVCEID